ncbi:B3 domain-containing protein Os01g0234100 [Linum grandiflorum]
MEEGDITRASYDDGAATLSLDTTTDDANPDLASLSAEVNNPIEKRERRLKIKLSCSDSKIDHEMSGHAGKCISCEHHEARTDSLRSPKEVKCPALIRAEEFQLNLEPAFPSFLSYLVRSHLGRWSWMGLPGPFCRANLPQEDTIVTLEDEDGMEFNIQYIGHRTGLSTGWRQFCVAHNLLEGDVLVFQLVGNCRFRVYIIRANDLAEVDGALCLLNLDAPTQRNNAELMERKGNVNTVMEIVSSKSSKKKRRKPQSSLAGKKKRKTIKPRPSFRFTGQPAGQSENDSEEVGSEVLEGVNLSLHALQFKDINSFEDFSIVIEGCVLDPQLTEEVRRKYYNLCRGRSAFLHDNLMKGLNLKLIVGIISETVNIADGMKECTLSTSRDEFTNWDKTLKASEIFGMNVGFLRARLKHLVNLAFNSEDGTRTRRYMEARAERFHTEVEIRNLEAKLAETKAACGRSESDVETVLTKAESYELKFHKAVLAPWFQGDDIITRHLLGSWLPHPQ